MDRKSRVILGTLLVVLGLAFMLVGPGRAWAEDFIDPREPLSPGPYVEAPGYEMDPPVVREPVIIRSDIDRTGGLTAADPLTDPITGPAPRRAERANDRDAAARSEQRARDLSGLEDGDISTTGDLAF